jgi:hypothetical protein
MAEMLSDDGTKGVAVASGNDRFEDLPDDVLQLLLSFLPSLYVVRTSALARRWRNLWKSVPSLRICIDAYENDDFVSVEAYNNFVNRLLEFRDRMTPLDVCVMIYPFPGGYESDAHQDVESWIQYAVSCKVSVLRILSPSVNIVICSYPTDLLYLST